LISTDVIPPDAVLIFQGAIISGSKQILEAFSRQQTLHPPPEIQTSLATEVENMPGKL